MRPILITFFLTLIWKFSFSLTASFTANVTSGCTPLEVTFTNTSTGAISYLWDFGDGVTSNDTNSSQIFYGTNKSYIVTLYAYDVSSNIDSAKVTITVTEFLPYFSFKPKACPNEKVKFTTGGNFNPANTYFWDFGDGFNSSSESAEHIYGDTGTYKIMLTVNNPSCGEVIDSGFIQIVPTLVPSVHLHSYSTGTIICPGENFPFFYDEDLPVFWDFGDSTYSTDPYPIKTYLVEGSYEATATVTNACGNKNSITYIIDVSKGVIPTMYAAVSKNIACPEEEILFTGQQGFGYNYAWDFNDGIKAYGSPVTHSFSSAGTYKVKLTITNECGNSDTISINVTVIDSIGVATSMFLYPKINCPGSSINYYSAPQFKSYLWNFGDGTTSNLSSGKHVFSNAGVYPVSLVVSNDCGNSITYYDTIRIDTTLIPDFNIVTNQSKYCFGSRVDFKTDNKDLVNYLWDFGNGNSDTVPAPSQTYNSTGVYTITLTAKNSCGKAFTAIKTIPIDSLTAPWIDFVILPGADVCLGSPVQFINTGSDSLNPNWSFGDSTFLSANSATHFYTKPGNYFVKLSAENACGETSSIAKVLTVSDRNLPVANIAIHDSSVLCVNKWVFLYNDYENPYYQYSWSINGVETSPLNNTAKVFSLPGMQEIALKVTGACGEAYDTAFIAIQDEISCGTSVKETITDNSFKIYPNPSSGIVSFNLSSLSWPYQVFILDNLGRVVYNVPINNKTEADYTIDVSFLSRGMYFLQLQSQKQTITKKLIRY